MDNKIHIGLSTDDNYVDFAMIVIRSVARFHPQNGKPLVFHIFTNGLSEGQRKRFSRYSSSQVEIKEIPVDTTAFHARWGISKPMYYRLEYANFLPDLARIIYLDCDVVVLDDIEKLWNMDLQGKPLAGVGDRAGLQEKRKCYCPDHIMFNSGVMLLDLDQWRMEGHVEKLAKFWHDNRSWMHFADQGLLNAYFGRNYTMLPQNWNIINSVYRNPAVPGMYTDEEVQDAIRNPGIVHFTGHHKPWLFWKSFHHPYGYTFCLCALDTPIGFWKKAKYWLKLHLHGWFVDSRKKRLWGRKDIRTIRW